MDDVALRIVGEIRKGIGNIRICLHTAANGALGNRNVLGLQRISFQRCAAFDLLQLFAHELVFTIGILEIVCDCTVYLLRLPDGIVGKALTVLLDREVQAVRQGLHNTGGAVRGGGPAQEGVAGDLGVGIAGIGHRFTETDHRCHSGGYAAVVGINGIVGIDRNPAGLPLVVQVNDGPAVVSDAVHEADSYIFLALVFESFHRRDCHSAEINREALEVIPVIISCIHVVMSRSDEFLLQIYLEVIRIRQRRDQMPHGVLRVIPGSIQRPQIDRSKDHLPSGQIREILDHKTGQGPFIIIARDFPGGKIHTGYLGCQMVNVHGRNRLIFFQLGQSHKGNITRIAVFVIITERNSTDILDRIQTTAAAPIDGLCSGSLADQIVDAVQLACIPGICTSLVQRILEHDSDRDCQLRFVHSLLDKDFMYHLTTGIGSLIFKLILVFLRDLENEVCRMAVAVGNLAVCNIHIHDAVHIRSEIKRCPAVPVFLPHINRGDHRRHIHQIFFGSQPEEGHLHLQYMEGCG